jgi:hypothetical protein
MRGQATQVREAEAAGLAAQGMDAGGGPSVAKRVVVDGAGPPESEPIAPRRLGPGVLELGGCQAGAHVRPL